MKQIFLISFACALTAIAAAGEEPYSCGYGGVNNKPVVPNEKVASEIYRAVAGGYSRFLLDKFPDITVRDGGDHWVVSQMNLAAAEKLHAEGGGEVVTIKKKGQLSLNIDKCIGTITKATINP